MTDDAIAGSRTQSNLKYAADCLNAGDELGSLPALAWVEYATLLENACWDLTIPEIATVGGLG